ncbi:MAG: NAD-dependent epimerase/dehydratase family protein [Leadbetterella sp.]
MKRVLLTGATGFIGGYIVDELLSQNYEIMAVVRASSDKARLQNKNIKFIELFWEDKSTIAYQLIAAGVFDLIIHNAGLTKALHEEDFDRINFKNTKNLIEAIQDSHCLRGRFVFVSSLAALGAAPDEADRVFENQIPRPLTHYGHSKLKAELYLKSSSLNWIIVRPTAVYGPWEKDILTFIKTVKTGFAFQIGSSDQKLSFIHGIDVAKSILLLANHESANHGVFTLSDGYDYVSDDLKTSVLDALGKKKVISMTLPNVVIYPIAALVEIMGMIRGIAPPLNRAKIAELRAKNWHVDVTWQNSFGFKPSYNLKKGMKETIAWYKENSWL